METTTDRPDVEVVGRFAMIPEWVLLSSLTPTAKLVYAILALHGWKGSECYPSKKRMAALAGVAGSTIDRALRDLRDAGAIEIVPRWIEASEGGPRTQTTNAYRVLMNPPGVTGDAPPGVTSDDPRTRTTPNERDRTTDVVLSERPSREARAPVTMQDDVTLPDGTVIERAPPLIKVDGRNLPYDVLAEVCGIRPGSPRTIEIAVSLNGARGSVGIRDLAWQEISPLMPGEGPAIEVAIADLVRARAADYRAAMKGAHLTPIALRKWWVDLPGMRENGSALDAARVAADEMRRL